MRVDLVDLVDLFPSSPAHAPAHKRLYGKKVYKVYKVYTAERRAPGKPMGLLP